MKKVLVSLLLAISISKAGIAQYGNVDSLLTVLTHFKINDTTRLALMNKLALAYLYQDVNKGRLMADSALRLSKLIHDNTGRADAFYGKGMNELVGGIITDARESFTAALQLYQDVHNSAGISKSLSGLGRTQSSSSENAAALESFTRALKIADSLQNDDIIGDVNNNMGINYAASSSFLQAMSCYQLALRAYEKEGSKFGVARVNVNMGNVYIDMKNPAKAIEHLQKGYDIFNSIHFKGGMSAALQNMGVAYRFLADSKGGSPDYRPAVDCFVRALELNKELGAKGGINWDIENLGQLYNLTGEYDSAIANIQQAMAFYKSEKVYVNVAKDLSLLANSILKAPDQVLARHQIIPSHRLTTALAYQLKAISISGTTSDLGGKAYEWKNLSLIYKALGQYKAALLAFEKFQENSDSAFNVTKNNDLIASALTYDFDRKQDSLNLVQVKKELISKSEITREKLIKNSIVLGAVVILVAAFTIFIFYNRKRHAAQKQKEAEFQAQVSDTEMKALRAQMNPHFIFNSLNSVADYIAKNNLQAADSYLTKFARLIRSVLEYSEKKEITLAEDLSTLELYMQLESLRLNHNFIYEISVDADIDLENTLVPPLLLQPFVENSIWHGLAKKEQDGKIAIAIHRDKNMIVFSVEDNGVGLQTTSTRIEGKSSYGIKITTARLEILNQTKGTNGTVHLTHSGQGTKAEVRLPLQLSF